MNRDFVCGLALLALALGYFALTAEIQFSQLADDVGADGLPRVYAGVLATLGLALAGFNLPRRAARPAAANDNTAPHSRELLQLRRALGVLGIGVLYVLLAPWIGYAPAIALVIVGTAVYQGAAFGWRLAAIGAGGALFLWLVFVVLLHIRQPAGLWPALGL